MPHRSRELEGTDIAVPCFLRWMDNAPSAMPTARTSAAGEVARDNTGTGYLCTVCGRKVSQSIACAVEGPQCCHCRSLVRYWSEPGSWLRTLTCPSRPADTMWGCGLASAATTTLLTVFWCAVTRRTSWPLCSMCQMHRSVPPAVTRRAPAQQAVAAPLDHVWASALRPSTLIALSAARSPTCGKKCHRLDGPAMVDAEQAPALPCVPKLAKVVIPAVTAIATGRSCGCALYPAACPHPQCMAHRTCITPTRSWPTLLR